MTGLFMDAAACNQSIGRWNTSAVTSLVGTFSGAAAFNQPLGWDTGAVEEMSFMFAGARSFDQELSWCISDSVEFEGVFAQPFASAFFGTACGTPACAVVQ